MFLLNLVTMEAFRMTTLNLFCLVSVNSGALFYCNSRQETITYENENPEFICIHRSNDKSLNSIRTSFLPLH